MGLERVEFLLLQGDQIIQGSETVGDFLLLFFIRTPSSGGKELTDRYVKSPGPRAFIY